MSVPKTVKIGGITFTVTEIGAGAFESNTKLKKYKSLFKSKTGFKKSMKVK